jgi:hypothetical protein
METKEQLVNNIKEWIQNTTQCTTLHTIYKRLC